MRKIYDYQESICVKGKTADFVPTSIWWHLRLLSTDQVVESEKRITFATFDEMWDYFNTHDIRNCSAYVGWFGKKKIAVRALLDNYVVTARNFKGATLWYHYQERSDLPFSTLMKELRADDLVAYLVERNNFEKLLDNID